MKKHYRQENDCLNCGTVLEGKYCHHCGQENLEIKENFGHLMNHAVSDYFHFDHQFFHTLKPLLFQPGKLTNEYMAGKRMQYLHPIKMYIFISLIFFVLLFKKANDDKENATLDKKISNKEAAQVKKSLDKTGALNSGQKAVIVNEVKKQAAKDAKSTAVVKDATDKNDDDDDVNQVGISGTPFSSSAIEETDDSTYNAYLVSQKKLPADEQDGFFRRLYEKKKFAYKKYGSHAREVFQEDFNHNIPKMMFVLLPLFALILSIAYWRNHKYYVEHLIFSFHLHSFIFLVLICSMLLQWILPLSWNLSGWIEGIVTIWIIYYIYKSFKIVYQRNGWRTTFKMAGISFTYLMVFSFCMLLLFVITAITSV